MHGAFSSSSNVEEAGKAERGWGNQNLPSLTPGEKANRTGCRDNTPPSSTASEIEKGGHWRILSPQSFGLRFSGIYKISET
jgi:hypothetical protein